MKTIRSYGSVVEAGFAQSLLHAAGIDACIADENTPTIGLDVRLQVPERDFGRALEILDGRADASSQSFGDSLEESGQVQQEIEAPSPRENVALNITCPNCGTGWELTPEEAERNEFACQGCKTTFPINPDLNQTGSGGFRGMLVFVLAAVILIGLGFGLPFVREFYPRDANAYYRSGISKKQNGDFDGAMADFDSAIGINSRFAAAFCVRGSVKLSKGDIDGAMADENQAIVLNQQMPEAYYYRCRIKREEGDFEGAIADGNQVIALEPNKPLSYVGRSSVKVAEGDIDGAMEDAEKAVAIGPNYAPAYDARGFVKGVKGDFDGAMADDNQAIALDPKSAHAYNSRGSTNALMRKWAAALADYRQCCNLSAGGQDHPRLYVYLIRARQGEREAAAKEISAYIDARRKLSSGPDDWAATIAGYLLGKMPEADFFAAADSWSARKARGHTCEAWYFAGMNKLLNGDENGAEVCLQKCIATQQRNYVESLLSKTNRFWTRGADLKRV